MQWGGLSKCSFVGPRINWFYIIILGILIFAGAGSLAYWYFDPLNQTDCNQRDKYLLYTIAIPGLITVIIVSIFYYVLYRARKSCDIAALLNASQYGVGMAEQMA